MGLPDMVSVNFKNETIMGKKMVLSLVALMFGLFLTQDVQARKPGKVCKEQRKVAMAYEKGYRHGQKDAYKYHRKRHKHAYRHDGHRYERRYRTAYVPAPPSAPTVSVQVPRPPRVVVVR